MKLIIAGSRSIKDEIYLTQALRKHGILGNFELVCGMASGVDTLGLRYAEREGLTIHRFPANWQQLGKRAGFVRNCEMGDFGDRLLAIWDGKSPGTRQMISYMKSLNKPTDIFKVDELNKAYTFF